MRKGSRERKVRTPKGSEPANGGALERLFDLEISNLRFQKGTFQATTSATENRPADALQILRSGI